MISHICCVAIFAKVTNGTERNDGGHDAGLLLVTWAIVKLIFERCCFGANFAFHS